MRFPCPHCQVMIDVVEPPPGSDVQCPQCGSRISSEMVQTTIEPPPEEQAIADRKAGLQPAQSSLGSPAGHVENVLHEAQPKELFGRFHLLERLGGGSFGEVYRAYDPSLDRVVALKRPHRRAPPRNEQEAKRLAEEARCFLLEAQAAAQLKHPQIVGVYEVGEIKGRPYFTAEYIRGIDLAKLIEREKKEGRLIPVRQVAQLCGQAAEALHAAHEVKIVHRDLKPANIIVGEDGLPRVMDFGMAKRESAAEFVVTQAGGVLGSPAYMSPEQWKDSSAVGRATDIWSLGVMLFEMLTGEFPFRASGDFVRLKKQILNDAPPPPSKLNSQVPADLDTLCLKCLEKDPTRRFPTAAALAEELRRYLNGEPIHSRPITQWERARKWCQRNPVVAGLSATVGIAVILLLLVIVVTALRPSLSRQLADLAVIIGVLGAISYYLLTDLWGRDEIRATESVISEHPQTNAATFDRVVDRQNRVLPHLRRFASHQKDTLRLIVRHPWSMIALPLSSFPLLELLVKHAFKMETVSEVLDRSSVTVFEWLIAESVWYAAIFLIVPLIVVAQIRVVIPSLAKQQQSDVARGMGRFAGIVVWSLALTIARPITGMLAIIKTPIACAAVFTHGMSRQAAIEWTDDRSHGLETSLVLRLITMAALSLGVSLMIGSFFEMNDRLLEAVAFGTMFSTWTASGLIAFEDMVNSATLSSSEIGCTAPKKGQLHQRDQSTSGGGEV